MESPLTSDGIRQALLLSVAIAGACLCAIGVAKFAGDINNTSSLAKPGNPLKPMPTPPSPLPPKTDIVVDAVKKAEGMAPPSIHVKPGDNLASIFQRQGLSSKDLYRVTNSQPLGSRLTDLYPGDKLTFVIGDSNELVKLTCSSGPLEKLEFTRFGDRFEGAEIITEPERRLTHKHAVIDHNLFLSSQRVGLPDAVTIELANIFRWDIDFVLDIRKGDAFHILLEERHLDGAFVSFGEILAAEFINQGKPHKAVLYTRPNGEQDYFDPNGKAMQKSFLQVPVDFTRISSHFNLRRKHPLWKHSKPHRGIDYAAPRGTPVRAAGTGVVVEATKTEPNGNYITLRHNDAILTKYLHLSKFARGIRSGTKVKQGDVIGHVGATGWATGPHLHYEFLVNGVHQNPRTATTSDVPPPVPDAEAAEFHNQATLLFAELDKFKNNQASINLGGEREQQSNFAVGR